MADKDKREYISRLREVYGEPPPAMLGNPQLYSQDKAEQVQAMRQLPANREYNPYYGGSQFEPSSYLPTVSSDPNMAMPLTSGRYVDPRIPSQQALVRAQDIQEFRNNPQGYVDKNAPELAGEQGLMDKGKDMLSRIFDLHDDPDLQMFGVPLSPIESIWDTTWRTLDGAYDLLNIGYGGIISAMPGGLRTLSYDELSGGKSVGEILQGQFEDGSAPSPGQIAIASIAVEAKRIREGGARLSDVLLANPATAPFILAGIAAESSPLQEEGFNILDKDQRERAFGSGWEKWMSATTDLGLMFADPLIGAGVAVKVTRAGLLGAKMAPRQVSELEHVSEQAVDMITTALGDTRTPEQYFAEMAQVAPNAPVGTAINEVKQGGRVVTENPWNNVPQIYEDTDIGKIDNILADTLIRVSRKNRETGEKVMSIDDMMNMPEIKANPNRGAVSRLLYDSDNVYEAALVLGAMQGSPVARKRLAMMAPALADDVLRETRQYMSMMAHSSEPQKLKEVDDYLSRSIENLEATTKFYDKEMEKLAPGGVLRGIAVDQDQAYRLLQRQRAVAQRSIDDAHGLRDILRGGEVDPMYQRSPFYSADESMRILDDMHRRQSFVSRALQDDIFESQVGARMSFPTRNNPYARMVVGSRERRGTAATQYAAEKTSWIPRKVKVTDEFGKATYKLDWWSSSQFDGVSRLRRQARVWRWLGTETPSGYIGLKGTSNVGSEREFNAALDLDLYNNKPIQVTYLEKDPVTGLEKATPIPVGGYERRQELFRMFYGALNNPNEDPMMALRKVEEEVMNDLMKAYGYTSDNAKSQFLTELKRADGYRAADLDSIQRTGMLVDENGTHHYVAYLETHLANGTYMHNFTELEKALRKAEREKIKTGLASTFDKALDVSGSVVGSLYSIFNDIWRPASLLRLSYTQRNVFEGMARAMAYSASLAPLSWPIKGTYYGLRNIAVRRQVSKTIAKAERRLKNSEFAPMWDEFTTASDEAYRLSTAVQVTDARGKSMMQMIVKQPGADTQEILMTPDKWQKALDAAHARVDSARDVLRSNAQHYTDAMNGTKFGEWRLQQIEALEAKLAELTTTRASLMEAADSIGNEEALLDPVYVNTLGVTATEIVETAKRLDMLEYNPLRGMTEYKQIAGRQKRIGSGTSMGPDGNVYADAFYGPLEQINRNLMSADNTTKQSLSGESGAFHNIFMRSMTRNNPVIEFSPANIDNWSKGMVDAIEDASSSRVMRAIMDSANESYTVFDEDAVVRWLMSNDKEAQIFITRITTLFGTDTFTNANMRNAAETAGKSMYDKSGNRLKAWAKTETPAGRAALVYDEDQIRVYVRDLIGILNQQMQGRSEFFALLRRRMDQKATLTEGAPIAIDDIKRVVNSLTPLEQRNLGHIQGSELVQTGMAKPLEIWSNMMNFMFRKLGTTPEDAIVRGPFYNQRYKAIRNELIQAYWARTQPGMSMKEIKAAKARTASGRVEGGTIEHGAFEIPAAEISRIVQLAHRGALRDTREWMYTIERRTKLGKYGEWIFPFISAQQNSVTVIGKLLYKEPWLAPMIYDLWRAPQKLGVEDENGNIQLPMPFPWVRDFLAEHPEIPFLGGAIDSMDKILIPKNGLNVWTPETGFGFFPRPTPWVQVGSSELMKAGAFPVETPQIFRSIFGEEAADENYQLLKDWVFGEEQGLSDKFLSWDRLFPASAQKLIYMRDTMSAQYGYQYVLQWNTQMMRFQARERDEAPTPAEIHKRTTNMFWFQWFGNMGMPTPLTPYPILTRPQVESDPLKVLQETFGKLRTANPETALVDMDRLFGDWAMQASQTKVTRGVGGAQPTPETVSDVQTLEPLIRDVAPLVGDNLDVLGILVNNRNSQTDYDQNSYQWQKSQTIPGTNASWRLVQSPEMSTTERQRIAGWTLYRKFIDGLDAQLQSAGFKSYEQVGAEGFKAAKAQFIANMSVNPDYEGWWVDYQDIGGNRTGAAVRTITAAVNDPGFVNLLLSSGKERTLSAMQEYVDYRNLTIKAVANTGMGIDAQENIAIKQAWLIIRQQLANSDPRFKEIMDIYLSGDESPRYLGMDYSSVPMVGVPNG